MEERGGGKGWEGQKKSLKLTKSPRVHTLG